MPPSRRHESSRAWPAVAVCLLAGLALTRLSAERTETIRSALHDAVAPVDAARGKIAAFRAERRDTEAAHLRDELARRDQLDRESERRLRVERLRNANLHEELMRQQASGTGPYSAEASARLLISDLVTAEVIGAEQRRLLRQRLIVSTEASERFTEDSLVVDAEPLPLLDQGADRGIVEESPVYAGRCVVGRIAAVGRWTSTVRPITDADYRGRAQILRTSGDGSAYGPEGILEGTGESLCRLRHIDRTESVEVGEEIYTGGRSASLPYPMYYGTVVRAELAPTDREWNIWVRPAVRPEQLRQVQILRQSANSMRILGH